MGRVEAYGHNSGENNSDSQMQGVRVVGADSPVGNPVPASNITVQLDGRGHGGSQSPRQTDDGDRGNSGAGGGEAKKEEPKHGGPQGKNSWWPNGVGKEEQPAPLIDVEAGEEDSATLRGVKSTKL